LIEAANKRNIVDTYEQARLEKELYPYDRQLVQSGLSGPRSLVLWYVLAKKDRQSVVQPQIEMCAEGADLTDCVYEPHDNIQHFHLNEYETGRIAVLGLEPDRAYRGRVRLLDEVVEFTARTAPSPGYQKPFNFI
jgi:hypothetical protein